MSSFAFFDTDEIYSPRGSPAQELLSATELCRRADTTSRVAARVLGPVVFLGGLSLGGLPNPALDWTMCSVMLLASGMLAIGFLLCWKWESHRWQRHCLDEYERSRSSAA